MSGSQVLRQKLMCYLKNERTRKEAESHENALKKSKTEHRLEQKKIKKRQV